MTTPERGCDEAAGVLLGCVPFVARWRARVRRVCVGVVVVSWRPKHVLVVDRSALRAYIVRLTLRVSALWQPSILTRAR